MVDPEARKGERLVYKKPYPTYIDQMPLPPGFKVPNFTLFNGEDSYASLVDHIGNFFVQCIAIENNPLLKLRLFGNSLSGQAFSWYTNFPANFVHTWEHMENAFYDYYYIIQPEITISDLTALKQSENEPTQDFITRFKKVKMKCRIPMEERYLGILYLIRLFLGTPICQPILSILGSRWKMLSIIITTESSLKSLSMI